MRTMFLPNIEFRFNVAINGYNKLIDYELERRKIKNFAAGA